jgi:hypothetical protein
MHRRYPLMKVKTKIIILWCIVLTSGFFLAYIWLGFFSPDPFYLSRSSILERVLFLYIPLTFFPIFYGIAISLILIKNKKLVQNILISIITVLVLFLIIYPLLDIQYYGHSKRKSKLLTEQYHPYLQLKPNLPMGIGNNYGKKTIRIFCLGGSTTEFKDKQGIGWPERLENELKHIYNTDSIIVFNLGRQWYTTLHTLINYEINLRKFKPDVIIVMHNINDFLQNADFSYFSKGPFREDYGHFYGPSANIFEQYGLFGKYWANLKHFWYYKPRVFFDQDSFPGLKSFTLNIKTLIELAKLDSTKVLLLSQPNIFSENMDEQTKSACTMVNREAVGKEKQWSFKTAFIGMKQYNARIKEIAENENVYYIDLEKFIPKSLKYFYDDVHYQDTTFTIISKSVSQEIARLGIISHNEK